MKPEIIFLAGPTAVGKTKVAIVLARRINAEIVSCDSMQIYKGMDILTSKPSLALRKIPHHLISIVSAAQEYNASRYYLDARRKIKGILKKGKVPLIVGGTGLYMSVLIDGIFKNGPSSKIMRNRLYRQAQDFGSGSLYERLKGVDAEAALKIHPHDTKRIVRALEVFETTGRPISYLQKQRKGLTDKYNIRFFGLNIERDRLYERIDERVGQMFRQGLIVEVKNLLKLKLSKTAACAIGIKEIKGFLDGEYGIEQAKRLMQRNSRQYAKRQLTWFRKDKRINWINAGDKERPAAVANRIWKELY